MTDKTEQSPSPQDDTRAVLQETLFAHVQTMLAACQTESFALQIPETATHILVGPRARIVEVLGLSAPDDLADTVSKALNRAWSLGQTYWQQADSEFARDHKKADATQEAYWKLVEETRAELARRCCAQREDKDRAYLANQSQAAQPTESINTEEFRKLLFTYTEALFGGSEKEQGKRFAALVAHVHAWHVTHLAGKSQAAIPEGAARSSDGTTYHGIAEIYHRFEEGESLHAVLDDKKVPRADADGKAYSLVGRVAQHVEAESQATMQAVPEGATNCTLNGGDVEGNQVFVSMDSKPSTHLWTVGGRAYLCESAPVAKEAQPEEQAHVMPPEGEK